jgi:Mor transcription activator family
MTSFLQFAETIGEDGAAILVRNFAGRCISIPSALPPGHPLEILGEHAPKLCHYHGGSRLYIPFQRSESRQKRDRTIKEAHDRSVSVSELAKEYQMCERAIWKILRKQRSLPILENQVLEKE